MWVLCSCYTCYYSNYSPNGVQVNYKTQTVMNYMDSL